MYRYDSRLGCKLHFYQVQQPVSLKMHDISAQSGVFPIDATAEISEADESVVLEAVYSGERFDPVADGDKVSSSIIKKFRL